MSREKREKTEIFLRIGGSDGLFRGRADMPGGPPGEQPPPYSFVQNKGLPQNGKVSQQPSQPDSAGRRSALFRFEKQTAVDENLAIVGKAA